jgi:hypothetical protein
MQLFCSSLCDLCAISVASQAILLSVSNDTSLQNDWNSYRKHCVVAFALHGNVKHMCCGSSMEDQRVDGEPVRCELVGLSYAC